MALLPRLSHLIGISPERARELASASLLLMLATGTLLALAVALAAPLLVPVVFGPGYENAVSVVRVLALVIPLLVANAALAEQWLIQLGLDRWLIIVVAIGAAFHLVIASLVIPVFGALAIAWMTVASQPLICAGLVITLRHHRLMPSPT